VHLQKRCLHEIISDAVVSEGSPKEPVHPRSEQSEELRKCAVVPLSIRQHESLFAPFLLVRPPFGSVSRRLKLQFTPLDPQTCVRLASSFVTWFGREARSFLSRIEVDWT
jgi:hypothetical protein